MNFREIENIENLVSSTEPATSGFQKEIISDYLEKEKRKSQARQNPFVYFYEDVINNSLSYDFQPVLGEKTYKNASDDALSCLNICDDFYKLSSWLVTGWLQNALKFTDILVLHYIQEVLKEIPRKFPNAGIEKARYKQLSEIAEEDIQMAGSILEDLYDLRNKLEHRTIIHEDGRQELLRIPRNKVRQTVVKLYPLVLKRFLNTYKALPQ